MGDVARFCDVMRSCERKRYYFSMKRKRKLHHVRTKFRLLEGSNDKAISKYEGSKAVTTTKYGESKISTFLKC